MPTICELKIQLKNKGIKGYSNLNKSGLEKLLATGKKEKIEPKKPEPKKPEPKPAMKKKKLKIVEPKPKKEKPQKSQIDNKSLATLERIEEKLENVVADKGVTTAERERAKKQLALYRAAIEKKVGLK